MHAILRISGNETSRPTTSPKADYDPEMLQSPIKAGLKQALACSKVTLHFRMIFPKKPCDWKSCREVVRKVKKIS